ncbi:MAG: glycosyltransferase [Planctomycetota bacterium]|nr:glycosyltransferase [Planctomycetota bacterium]
MPRTWIKDRVRRSALLQRLYARSCLRAARREEGAGRLYAAARVLLRAEKHLPPSVWTPKRRAVVRRLIRASCYDGDQLRKIERNVLRASLLAAPEGRIGHDRYNAEPIENRVRFLWAKQGDTPERQGDLMVLKAPDDETGERGVILLMFHETIEFAAAYLDLPALAEDWTFVLETSNWGAADARFLPWLGSDLDVHVMAPRRVDFEWFEALDANLTPVRVGSGEWVPFERFQPLPDEPKQFDIAMVASWDRLKRHELLFQAMASVRRKSGRALTAALIGYPLGWPRSRVEALARKHGVEAEVTFHEDIPQEEVSRLVALSRVSVLLSREEGSNRSVYESLFVDTPVIVYAEHKGIDLEQVNAETGILAADDELAEALLRVIDAPDAFTAGAWARAHTGWSNAHRRLNEHLRAHATRAGRPWTTDIAAKVNAPSQKYAEPGAYAQFDAAYQRLAPHLLAPADG